MRTFGHTPHRQAKLCRYMRERERAWELLFNTQLYRPRSLYLARSFVHSLAFVYFVCFVTYTVPVRSFIRLFSSSERGFLRHLLLFLMLLLLLLCLGILLMNPFTSHPSYIYIVIKLTVYVYTSIFSICYFPIHFLSNAPKLFHMYSIFSGKHSLNFQAHAFRFNNTHKMFQVLLNWLYNKNFIKQQQKICFPFHFKVCL